MIFGMSLATYTQVHVVISLIAMATGLIVVYGMIAQNRFERWTAVFLLTTVLTSVTGFGFPFVRVMPAHIFGVISLVVLTLAIVGLYVFRLAGAWRKTYVISSIVALYLNSFVGVVQAFQKIPVLNAAAPTQSEPPFLIAQLSLLALFIVLGVAATKKFRETKATVPVKALARGAGAA